MMRATVLGSGTSGYGDLLFIGAEADVRIEGGALIVHSPRRTYEEYGIEKVVKPQTKVYAAGEWTTVTVTPEDDE